MAQWLAYILAYIHDVARCVTNNTHVDCLTVLIWHINTHTCSMEAVCHNNTHVDCLAVLIYDTVTHLHTCSMDASVS